MPNLANRLCYSPDSSWHLHTAKGTSQLVLAVGSLPHALLHGTHSLAFGSLTDPSDTCLAVACA